ncbi:endonuclease G [Cupriavidus sp. YR651]|uniref:DNA/RNA non-specific endonuclease n=1 Tax=Cupriavidus sp. YR651 TaxID=1855315 RepID=UPI0008921786|nr:DNA/RNA non-specific endonuclease [Cupriavidus sp. YR651]SDD57916.1 endonuclease G [Cupriavidus sp. YR651]
MIRQLAVAAILALASLYAGARDSQSPQCAHVLGTGQPSVGKITGGTQLLCYRGYAVLYSSQTRTALWSAERLTREGVDAARKLPRDSDFYEEGRLPEADRAKLTDYGRRSGFDRGHLAPSGDFPDMASQAESFSLANVVPQDSVSNRRTWSHIETSTRKLARQYGSIQVVTGPAFVGNARMLGGRVRIPDFIWKAIYVPGTGAAAYIARNDATPAYSVITVDELRHFTGIDPFPTLSVTMRSTAIDLPPPTPHPGEKAARRVAFAWLVSGDRVEKEAITGQITHLVRDAGTLASLLLAYSR